MDFAAAQREIDALLETLKKAKSIAGLRPDDPSLVALERIMMRKVGVLEAAKTEMAQRDEAIEPDPGQDAAAVFFAPVDEGPPEPVRELRKRQTR